VAFGVGCRAGIHAMAFASVVPGACSNRAGNSDQQDQEYPTPSIQHLRAPLVKQRITDAPKRQTLALIPPLGETFE
jgi:hypothetical protein